MNVEKTTGDEIELLLPWYVNGTLSGEERRTVEKHLQACVECRTALRELQQVANAVEQENATPLIPEPPVEQFLEDAFSQSKSAAAKQQFRWYAVAASVLLLVGVGYLGALMLPEANVFRTVTDPSGTAEIAYIFDIEADSSLDEPIRAAIGNAFAGSQLAAVDEGYRLTVSMPSATMKELDEFANVLRDIEGIQQVEIVGVQLPLE